VDKRKPLTKHTAVSIIREDTLCHMQLMSCVGLQGAVAKSQRNIDQYWSFYETAVGPPYENIHCSPFCKDRTIKCATPRYKRYAYTETKFLKGSSCKDSMFSKRKPCCEMQATITYKDALN